MMYFHCLWDIHVFWANHLPIFLWQNPCKPCTLVRFQRRNKHTTVHISYPLIAIKGFACPSDFRGFSWVTSMLPLALTVWPWRPVSPESYLWSGRRSCPKWSSSTWGSDHKWEENGAVDWQADQYRVCSDADSAPVRFHDEGAELKGEALDLPVDLRSYPH